MFVKKNIIVTNPSKIDVKQKEQDTAKGLCYEKVPLEKSDKNCDPGNFCLKFSRKCM